MKKTVALLSTLSAVFLFACDGNDNNGNSENLPAPILLQLSEAEIQMTKSGNSSAMNFFSVVNELQKDKENIVLSPLSLNMALAMVWNGANGETEQAIQQTMGLGDYSPEEVNKYFDNLRKTFVKTDPSTQLSLANSIWYHLGFPVKAAFIETNKTWYDAEVREIDFSDSQAPAVINQWCSDNTNGLIKEMIETIPSNTMMYLLNALYFKSQWADQFGFNPSATTNEQFTKEDGSEVQVKMMRQNNILEYYQDDYLQLTALPYGNKAFSMLFILPQPDVSFAGLATRLKQEGYWEQPGFESVFSAGVQPAVGTVGPVVPAPRPVRAAGFEPESVHQVIINPDALFAQAQDFVQFAHSQPFRQPNAVRQLVVGRPVAIDRGRLRKAGRNATALCTHSCNAYKYTNYY
jgi:serpin B